MRATVDTRVTTSLAKTGPLRQERFVTMSEFHRLQRVCTSVKHVSHPSDIYIDYKCVGDNQKKKILVTKRKAIFISSRQGS